MSNINGPLLVKLKVFMICGIDLCISEILLTFILTQFKNLVGDEAYILMLGKIPQA